MRVCTRCGNLATAQQRYCARCVAPLDPPANPSSLPADRSSLPGDPPGAMGPRRAVLPALPGYPRPVSPRQIFVPDAERRAWDLRAQQAGDYDDMFAGDEAETSVLPPLVIDDPLPADQDDLGGPGDSDRGYWDDGDDGGRGYGGRGYSGGAHGGRGQGGRHGTGGRLVYPSADPRHASDGRRAQIASAVLGTVLVLAGFLTVWAAVSRHGLEGSGTRLSSSQTSAPRGRAHPGTGPGHSSPARSPRATPARSAPSVPATPGPASGPAAAATVALAPGVGQDPAAGPVRSLLVSYFTAINQHQFSQYAQSFLPPLRHKLSSATFAAGYGSTTDTGITLVSITAARQGLAATITFTSSPAGRARREHHRVHRLGHHPVPGPPRAGLPDRHAAAQLPCLPSRLRVRSSDTWLGWAACTGRTSPSSACRGRTWPTRPPGPARTS